MHPGEARNVLYLGKDHAFAVEEKDVPDAAHVLENRPRSWRRPFVYDWPSPAEHDLAWHTVHEGEHHFLDHPPRPALEPIDAHAKITGEVPMSAHRFFWLDVFADCPLQGNPLAVLLDADDVPDEVMQAFALETNLSETTFVQSPRTDGASYRNRIWTCSGEVPFAGHPSLGTAVAVATAAGDAQGAYVQETHAGLQRVACSLEEDGATASVEQQLPDFAETVASAEVMTALELHAEDATSLPCQVSRRGWRPSSCP